MDLKSRMKKLVVIVGANGVGKSTTAKELVARCERMAYVDSDWCRVMNPFAFTEITKQTVTENIYCLIHNYLCCNQQIIGSIETYENEFHKENCYVKFEFEEYDLPLASEIFALLQNHIKRPLQVMLASSEEEKIAFLEKAGFVCKRKCYEVCVTADDLCDMENVVHIENGNTFMCCGRGAEEYDMCTRFLYEYYRNVHEAVNPLTASYEEFLKLLPDEVYYDSYEGEVRHIAFVEENEIAYVGSRDKSDFGRFITGVVRNLFNLYEELTFEYDDCDETAIVLKDLFEAEVEESYNTYVREWDI